MPHGFLIDTDVLIDYLRDEAVAVSFLENLPPPLFISTSVAELFAGVREGDERTALAQFLTSFLVVSISEEIAVTGGLLRRDYGRSHGTGINDALVAATAKSVDAELITLNRKHFPMFTSLSVPYEKV